MKKIRRGDTVVVLTGKDRGKQGVVLRIAEGAVVVEGVNRVKKHVRPNPMKGVVGGIVEKDMPIHLSNVALFDQAAKKGSRVGVKTLDDGRKVRVVRASGEMVEA